MGKRGRKPVNQLMVKFFYLQKEAEGEKEENP